ncbi:hypothetical protein HHI36_022976 [Cryptolaemus montrouzieri]|uniref:Uncharacterized protein n=1 Tax=Cryptolaemus montrouzieri TaxID=559131 RepID=A0ABD2PF85_9CUCU
MAAFCKVRKSPVSKDLSIKYLSGLTRFLATCFTIKHEIPYDPPDLLFFIELIMPKTGYPRETWKPDSRKTETKGSAVPEESVTCFPNSEIKQDTY